MFLYAYRAFLDAMSEQNRPNLKKMLEPTL